MSLFTVFVFGAVALGAGVMLAPALPMSRRSARQHTAPRVGLAAALALAFVITGALFLTSLFGWDTLTIDYLWFALLVGIFLGGTLSVGLRRSEEVGLHDFEIGWPGVREIAFFLLVLAVLVAPLLVLPVPLDTDAQGFGYLALSLREGGSLTTLAPFHPEIEYLYSPGFPALAAYLSQQLDAGLHMIQFAAAAVLGLIFIWLLWDLGNEVEDWLDPHLAASVEAADQASADRAETAGTGRIVQSVRPAPGGSPSEDRPLRHTGAILAVLGLVGTGLLTAYLDSHYTTLMALVFALAFLIFITRYLRGGRWPDALFAAVCLGAVPLSHPDTTIILALGYVPWLGTVWLARPRPTVRRWLVMAVAVPGGALLGLLPWLSQIAPLLGSGIASPFEISAEHWKTLVFMHGGVIVLLALGGAVIALRRRTPLDLLMVGWLILVVDFSTTGILERLTFGLLEPLLKYDYPFSIAWHGPIIPYAYLGATAVLWLARRIGWTRLRRWYARAAWPVLGMVALVLALAVMFAEPLLAASKGVLGFYGAFASHDDVAAMRWLRDNSPADALVLNFPGPQEGDWAPVISERDAVFFRPQPFYRHTGQAGAVQADLYGFWQHPADLLYADRLRGYGVDYVLVPQVVGNPEAFDEMWRWREPFAWGVEARSAVADAPYLELVADFDGAQVYAVR